MGSPMARRWLQAGLPLTVWNRSPAKAQALASDGAQVAPSAAQAVAGAEIVVTMLQDGVAVADLLFEHGVAAALTPGSLWIDMSSVLPSQARDWAQRLAPQGVACLDAPVSGGTVGATAGSLAIMVGGSAADFERAATIFAPLGRATHVGPCGAGQLAKLVNQMIVGISIGAVAEALLLAAAGGADMHQVRQALRGGFAESRVLDVHGQRMVDGDFAKRGSLAIQLKDLRNASTTAAELGFSTPITQALLHWYEQAAERYAELDQSALFCELQRINRSD